MELKSSNEKMTICTLPLAGFMAVVPTEDGFVGLITTGATSLVSSGKIGNPPSSINWNIIYFKKWYYIC